MLFYVSIKLNCKSFQNYLSLTNTFPFQLNSDFYVNLLFKDLAEQLSSHAVHFK